MDKRRPPQSDSRRRSVSPSGSRPVSRSGAPSGRRPVSPPARRAAPSKKMPPRQADPRSGQIQAVQQRRKRKRKRNYTLYYILLFFILTVAGIILSLTVFFNVRTIELTGSNLYTTEDVLPILGAEKGDNLLRIKTSQLRDNVFANFLQADEVKVRRVFPSTLWVEVTDGVPEVQMENAGNYYSISGGGRVLKIASSPEKGNGIVLLGVDLADMKVGDFLADKKTDTTGTEEGKAAAEAFSHQLQTVESLFSAMEEARVTGITAVDVSDELKLTVYWENRVQVVLGSFSELSYKLRLCKAILEDPTRIASDARGVLDAETASSAGVFFRPSTELVCPGEDSGAVWNWSGEETEAETGADSDPADPSLPEGSLEEPGS